MVYSVESGRRMAAMARILDAGSFSQGIPEVGHQKLISRYVRRGLRSADEANLLDEEDMNVYGLMPMEDPLHLVCCNACKKPVKASQFATHAELCRFLISGESILEVDAVAQNRKPPKKERKKLLKPHSYKIKIPKEPKRPDSIKGDDTFQSKSHFDYQVETTPFFSLEDKTCVDVVPEMDHSGGSLGYTDQSGSLVLQRKRSKWIADDSITLSDDLGAVCGEVFSQAANACGEFPNGSVAGIGTCRERGVGQHRPKHIGLRTLSCLPTQDIPGPLATKVFYSQRNNRLRSAVSLMYHGAYTEEYSNEFPIQGPLPGTSVE